MKRRSFLISTAALCTQGAVAPLSDASAAHAAGLEPSPSARQIQKATAAALAMQRRDWEQGILAQAFREAGNRDQVVLLTKAAIVQQTPDGRLGVVNSGGPTDPAMGGAAYAKAAEWTGDPSIRQAVEGLLNWIRFKAPRNANGILYHVFGAPEILVRRLQRRSSIPSRHGSVR